MSLRLSFFYLQIILLVLFLSSCSSRENAEMVSQQPCNQKQLSKEEIILNEFNPQGSFTFTPLMQATYENNLQRVQTLLQEGANVDERFGYYGGGATALMIAARNGNIPIMQALITAGANVNAVAGADMPSAGKPVLQYAIESQSLDAVKLLIKVHASADAAADNPIIHSSRSHANQRNLPLLSSAINSNSPIAIIKELLVAGANPNKIFISGWTPLMVAAYHGNSEAVKALLAAGADPALTNKNDTGWIWYRNGRTARDYAQEQGHLDIVQLLQQ